MIGTEAREEVALGMCLSKSSLSMYHMSKTAAEAPGEESPLTQQWTTGQHSVWVQTSYKVDWG